VSDWSRNIIGSCGSSDISIELETYKTSLTELLLSSGPDGLIQGSIDPWDTFGDFMLKAYFYWLMLKTFMAELRMFPPEPLLMSGCDYHTTAHENEPMHLPGRVLL